MAHQHLTLSEREMIAHLVAAGESLREIARTLARSPSTISRELHRNRQRSGFYSPHLVQQQCRLRRGLANEGRGGGLRKRLRHSRKRRRRYGGRDHRGRIRNRRGMELRPAVVSERVRLGDWEGDTLAGRGGRGYLLTQVE